ncbi:sugar efflux transporter [Actinospica sp. MGRD01-02]|uniref:Sugar efflux transporter n=1 Tax=Actinospica acidithermotolerans TaxID=2828514 RepID=A0A941E4D8_9ACTN|nr:sugar efflux transporter [Actinospica acidithermotolerans]MBR7826010.1 sugar efflux transporter [Actinospica acidithermotolerans]
MSQSSDAAAAVLDDASGSAEVAGRLAVVKTFLSDGGLLALSGTTAMVGIGGAMVVTTLSLFLADAVGATPLMIGLFFAGRAVLEMSTDLLVGVLSDRIGNRKVLVALALMLSSVGAVCYMLLRNYYAIFACGVVFWGVGGSCFAQLLAYTREMADTSAIKANTLNSVMRSITSVAWIAGPPLGFWLIAAHGFTGLYIPAGLLYFLAGALALWKFPNLRVERDEAPKAANPFRGLNRRARLLMIVIVLLLTVNSIYQIDISLTVTRALHLGAGVAGLLLGFGAALEVPVLIYFGARADRYGMWRLMLAAAVGATVFFSLLPLATTRLELLVLQVPNAFWTSLVLSLPVIMLQNIVDGGLGTASALYSSSFKFGTMLGGATAGVVAEWFGYSDVFWVCAVLAAVAACLLVSGKAYRHEHAEHSAV